jgi:hypothetical protein
MVELLDTYGLGPYARKSVGVEVPLWSPNNIEELKMAIGNFKLNCNNQTLQKQDTSEPPEKIEMDQEEKKENQEEESL